MSEDEISALQRADSLYQSFPDFSLWPAPADDGLELWDRFASRLQESRQNATPEALRQSVEVAVRAAAIDTGAIEGLYSVDRGFTMTVATQAFAWENALAEKGERVRELFEAQLETYEMVIDAVTQLRPITEVWIRSLHETVCAGQPTYEVLTGQGRQVHELSRGKYKTLPNHVLLIGGGTHSYAPVDQVPSEMHRLLEQIRTPEFENAHPAAQASYLHYAFVAIHPFADGNGRVARALASVYFYRAHSIPFLVFANQKNAYLDALRQADLGQRQDLVAFFLNRGVDTVQLVVEHLLAAEAPSPANVAARLRLNDEVALKLLEVAKKEIRTQFKKLALPTYFELYLEPTNNLMAGDEDFRQVMGSHSLEMAIEDFEINRTSERYITVLISRDRTDPFLFCLFEIEDEKLGADYLDIRFEDVHPDISKSLQIRLESWCSRLLGRMLRELEDRPANAGE